MKKDFESRFMPNVKFRFLEPIRIKDTSYPPGLYYILDDKIVNFNQTGIFDDSFMKEVHYLEAIPELIPDGMRYNKELDKLVPDVIEYKSNQEIETLFKEAMKQNKDNLSIISEISKELSSKYPFYHKTVFYIVRDNFLSKGKDNLKENSIEELDKLATDSIQDKKSATDEYTAGIDLSNDLQDILESDMKYGDKIRAIRNTSNQAKEQITPHYYGETCLCGRKIDWYVIGDLYRKNKGSAWDHAGKKLLRAGEGHKTLKEDIKEVINSLTRWLEQIEDKEKTNVK